jgi:hypothetical protein
MNTFPYDIFISYSQKDREAAERLQAAFKEYGLEVCRAWTLRLRRTITGAAIS